MILNVLASILIALLALLLLLFFIPFCYSIRLTNNDDCFYYQARVHWFFGLFQLAYDNNHLFHMRLFGILIKIKNKEKTKKKQVRVKGNQVKKKNKRRKVTKKGVKYFVECFGDIIRKYSPEKLAVSGQMGFEDPSITGFIQGLTNVFNIPLDTAKLEFIYGKKVYNGSLGADGKVALYYLVFTFLKLVLYKPTRLMLR